MKRSIGIPESVQQRSWACCHIHTGAKCGPRSCNRFNLGWHRTALGRCEREPYWIWGTLPKGLPEEARCCSMNGFVLTYRSWSMLNRPCGIYMIYFTYPTILHPSAINTFSSFYPVWCAGSGTGHCMLDDIAVCQTNQRWGSVGSYSELCSLF